MVWDIRSALGDEAIQSPCKLLSEYRFELKGLSSIITIRLYEYISTDTIMFEQSHYIHTPSQVGPYITDVPWGDYEAYALHLAVNTILPYYKEAVSKGHQPSDKWLVVNDNFLGR